VPVPNEPAGAGVDPGWMLSPDLGIAVVDGKSAGRDFLAFLIMNDNHNADRDAEGAFSAQRLYVYDGTELLPLSSMPGNEEAAVLSPFWIEHTKNAVVAIWSEFLGAPGGAQKVAARSFQGVVGASTADIVSDTSQLNAATGTYIRSGIFLPDIAQGNFISDEDGHVWSAPLGSNLSFGARVQLDPGDAYTLDSSVFTSPGPPLLEGSLLFFSKPASATDPTPRLGVLALD